MKKLFKNALLFMVSFATLAGFTACSEEDGDPIPQNVPLTSGTFYCNYYFTADVLAAFDVTMTITDVDGKQIKEVVTMDKCTTDVPDFVAERGLTHRFQKGCYAGKLPATVSYEVTYKVKSSLPERETFKIGRAALINFVGNNGDGFTSGAVTYHGDVQVSGLANYESTPSYAILTVE